MLELTVSGQFSVGGPESDIKKCFINIHDDDGILHFFITTYDKQNSEKIEQCWLGIPMSAIDELSALVECKKQQFFRKNEGQING
jgi:hypothetical protein